VSSKDEGFFKKGEYAYSLSNVKTYLNAYDNVVFCQGEFPLSASSYKGNNFSFVHLDVDTHDSTKIALSSSHAESHLAQ
jgi:hypothetical protein